MEQCFLLSLEIFGTNSPDQHLPTKEYEVHEESRRLLNIARKNQKLIIVRGNNILNLCQLKFSPNSFQTFQLPHLQTDVQHVYMTDPFCYRAALPSALSHCLPSHREDCTNRWLCQWTACKFVSVTASLWLVYQQRQKFCSLTFLPNHCSPALLPCNKQGTGCTRNKTKYNGEVEHRQKEATGNKSYLLKNGSLLLLNSENGTAHKSSKWNVEPW